MKGLIKTTDRLTAYERDSIMTIHKDKEIFNKLCPTNRRLIYDFLLYISIASYTYQTCTTLKASAMKFFIWNYEYNKDTSFYSVKKSHFTNFFAYLATEEKLGYERIYIIKSHLSTLSDFCENIIGHKEYIWNHKVVHNKWYNFTNVVKDAVIPVAVKGEPKVLPSNINDIDTRELEKLRWYLKETKDYEAYVVLYFAHLGEDILNLTVDEVMEQGDAICKRWVRFLERYGIPFKNAIVIQFDYNTWRPATKEDLNHYEQYFSQFLKRKFIICNDYRL